MAGGGSRRAVLGALALASALLAAAQATARASEAQPICSVIRILLLWEQDARRLLALGTGPEAAELREALESRLDRVFPYAVEFSVPGRNARAGRGASDAGSAVLAFIAGRRKLLDLHRSGPPGAAQGFAAASFYRQQLEALEAAWHGPGGCLAAAAAPEADGARQPGAAALRAGTPQQIAPGGLSAALAPLEGAGVRGSRVLVIPLLALMVAALSVAALAAWDQRLERRYPCNLPARLGVGKEVRRGRIMDISRRGAKFRADSHDFRPGQAGRLLMGGMAIEMRIVWVNEHFVGMKFRRAIELSPRRLSQISDRLEARGRGLVAGEARPAAGLSGGEDGN